MVETVGTLSTPHGPCGKIQVSMAPGRCGFHNLALQDRGASPFPRFGVRVDAGIFNRKAIYQVCHENQCVWVFQKTFYGVACSSSVHSTNVCS